MINHSATSDICDKQAINALAAADPALGPTKDNVAVIAPMFANEKDQGTAYPYEESNALAWTGAEWAYGRNNIYPAYSTNTSSFHVLDEIVAYYQDQNLFPNMHEIVVAAHSMGAQLVQRYAALTEGTFDPTVQPLWTLYSGHFSRPDAGPAGPHPDALNAALDRVSHRHLLVGRDRIAFARRGMALTLNGIAPGYVTDRIVDLLRAEGIDRTLVDMGESRAIGTRPDGRPWDVAVADPDEPDPDPD